MTETTNGGTDQDSMSEQLFQEARRIEQDEPELSTLLHRTVLSPCIASFEDAVASTVCYRLLLHPCGKPGSSYVAASATSIPSSSTQLSPIFCPNSLRQAILKSMQSEILELGHTMRDAVREDVESVVRRDPATDSILEVILFSKGFAALVCHRAAYRLFQMKKKYTALFLQSQASAVFGLDIHPRSQIGSGVMLDHGTGVVIGETAVVGDGCTLLHGVTLGGTGKDHGDRHPKVGRNVLIGAGSSILGNIRIGDGAKIGAGSVVLRPIPAGATAVGAPAKIIGRAAEMKPGSDVDETLQNVDLLHKSPSVANIGELLKRRPSSTTDTTVATTATDETEDETSIGDGNVMGGNMCPWREYARMAKMAPEDSVTICTLRKLLLPEGCTNDEIGDCLFELDTRNVGYVHMDIFQERAVEVIVNHTTLDEHRAEDLLSAFIARYEGDTARRKSLALRSSETTASNRQSVAVG